MSTLLRITPTATNGWALIVVEWTHAESLQRHIRTLRLETTPIQEMEVLGVRVDRDEKGKPIFVGETMNRSFSVQTSPKALLPIVKEWLKSFD